MTTRVQGNAQPGDYVHYSDMANPGTTYVVVARRVTEWGTDYEMTDKDGTRNYSDCRQHGWTFSDKYRMEDQ